MNIVWALAQSPQASMEGMESLWATANEAAAALVDPAGNGTPASLRVLTNQDFRDAVEALPGRGVIVTKN